MTHRLSEYYQWILVMMVFLSPAHATELVHRFQSPTNGGNALNGSFLFNQATDQNNFKDPAVVAAAAAAAAKQEAAASASTSQSNLEVFKNRLQNAILTNLSTKSASSLFDDQGNILTNQNLSFDLNGDGTSDFTVAVGGIVNNTVAIKIGDGITETTLTVPYK